LRPEPAKHALQFNLATVAFIAFIATWHRVAEWWIENVLEELDEPEEWYFNETSKKLYYFFNSTAPPTGNEKFVATKTKVLWNLTGSQATPVKDVTIRGLEIRDTAYTYLGTDQADLHGMPSGGTSTSRPGLATRYSSRIRPGDTSRH
jgi:hypothetical protein